MWNLDELYIPLPSERYAFENNSCAIAKYFSPHGTVPDRILSDVPDMKDNFIFMIRGFQQKGNFSPAFTNAVVDVFDKGYMKDIEHGLMLEWDHGEKCRCICTTKFCECVWKFKCLTPVDTILQYMLYWLELKEPTTNVAMREVIGALCIFITDDT
jgi:hypothetical protein